jgi:hypothetical protein
MAQTPSAPTSSAELSSTRQMLDELDALMERMLSLPVEDEPLPEERPTAPPVAALPPAATVSASLTIIPTETPPREAPVHGATTRETQIYQTRVAFPDAPEDSRPGSYFDLPESPLRDEALADLEAKLPTLEETTLSWLEEREAAAQSDASRPTRTAAKGDSALPTIGDVEVSRVEPIVVPSARRMRGFWLWLILRAINGAFDLATYLLGPIGVWLRSPRGRNLLGAAGILMVLGAVGWLAVLWMGWP